MGQPIMILPLNTLLDAEVKQGEFWKVTVDNNGVKTTGYVHEFLVEEVGESDLQGDAPRSDRSRPRPSWPPRSSSRSKRTRT